MTSPERPTRVQAVEYKGEPLDAERGPGLGCFRFQLGLLLLLVILTPLSVAWSWPPAASAALLFLTLILLLFAGQTVIFLLRLVAAERGEGRRRPRASATKTVGELEDEAATTDETATTDEGGLPDDAAPADQPPADDAPGDDGRARPSDPVVRE